jgi:hypothetical protein
MAFGAFYLLTPGIDMIARTAHSASTKRLVMAFHRRVARELTVLIAR